MKGPTSMVISITSCTYHPENPKAANRARFKVCHTSVTAALSAWKTSSRNDGFRHYVRICCVSLLLMWIPWGHTHVRGQRSISTADLLISMSQLFSDFWNTTTMKPDSKSSRSPPPHTQTHAHKYTHSTPLIFRCTQNLTHRSAIYQYHTKSYRPEILGMTFGPVHVNHNWCVQYDRC